MSTTQAWAITRWAETMENNQNTERRKNDPRRHADSGPPPGIAERRINIERRLFNVDFGQLSGRQTLGATDKPAGLRH